MLESIILVLAMYTIGLVILRNVDSEADTLDIVMLLTSCILWGIFYYLTKN